MTSSETLNQLLDQGLEFDPHYLPSMNSDHLPMTLCAMAGLGASDSSHKGIQAAIALAARKIAGLIDETEVLSALTGSLLAAHMVAVEYREYGDNRYMEAFEGFRQRELPASWVQIPA